MLRKETSMRNLVVDVDYVLLDYGTGYRNHWERLLGRAVTEKDPNAYWAKDRYDVPTLTGDDLTAFRKSFDETFWKSLEPLDKAIEAYLRLSEVFNVIACTASDPKFNEVRQDNLRSVGFTGIVLHSVGQSPDPHINPKANTINSLNPVAVVDDLPLGLSQLNAGIHRFLIARNHSDSRSPARLEHNKFNDPELHRFYYDGPYDSSGLREVVTHLFRYQDQFGF